MPPLISFETGRKTQTQSSGQPESCASKWKSGSSIKKKPRLRSQHTRRRTEKNLHPRSSEARQESFLPLDKDLSWKSAYRRTGFRAISIVRLRFIEAVKRTAKPGSRPCGPSAAFFPRGIQPVFCSESPRSFAGPKPQAASAASFAYCSIARLGVGLGYAGTGAISGEARATGCGKGG